MFRPTSLDFTTALLLTAALFIIYVRVKGWLDSNLPLFYYGVMTFYTSMVDSRLAPSVVYSGLGLALLLRFEFLNTAMARIIQMLELIVLLVIVVDCLEFIFRDSGFLAGTFV